MARTKPTNLAMRYLGLSALALASAVVGLGAGASAPAGASSSGPSWSVTTTPAPSNANATVYTNGGASACGAPGNCVIVGSYLDASDLIQPYIDTLSNGTWSSIEAPLPANAGTDAHDNANSDLFAVSCVNPTSCVAVGYYEDDHGPHSGYDYGLIETLANGTWTPTQAPQPANSGTDGDGNQNTSLEDVDCAAVGVCTAIGFYTDTVGYEYGLLDTLSGGSWTPTQAPQPANSGNDGDHAQYVELESVSCPSSSFCAVVGTYQDTMGRAFGLIETGSGNSWVATQAPEPANSGTDLDGNQDAELIDVSCSSPGNCAAVGDYDISPGGYQWGLTETLAGGTWTAISTPVPAGAGTNTNQFVESDAVECPADGSCISVGQYEDAQGRVWGLIDTLSAGSWVPLQGPEPANADTNPADSPYSYFEQISCSWPGQCVATGSYPDPSGHRLSFVDSLSNGVWTTMESLLPANARANPLSDISSVSCVAAFCVTSGDYKTSSGDQEGYINTFQGAQGYDLAASDGGIFAYGSPFFGSMGGMPLNKPVVGIAINPATDGYWEVASDGGLFAFAAPFYGSMGGMPLNQPVVGMAFDSLTGGYYEVASDGGIFAFNAPFFGSMGGKPLNQPIVGIAFDPETGGYYEVASDGGLFAFNAPFLGSMGGTPINKPVVGMTVDTTTGGYYEVASDGGLFAFGAPFLGSTGNITLNKPVVGMAFDYYTNGYYEVATDGGLFAFGAPFLGSTGNITLNQPVVGMGVT